MASFKARLKITTKILLTLLGLSLASLVSFTYISVQNMGALGDYALAGSVDLGERAVEDSAGALRQQTEESLVRLAEDQAAIANALLEKVAGETRLMSSYASKLWAVPPNTIRPTFFQTQRPPNINTAPVVVLAPGLAPEGLRSQLGILSNMDDILVPTLANDANLAQVYMGIEAGAIRLLPWTTGIDATYDPRKREWYKKAAWDRRAGWTNPYVDWAGSWLKVTCVEPVFGPDGKMLGVVGADLGLETLNSSIINTQVGKRGYAFLLDAQGNVIARPGVDRSDRRWDETFRAENLLESGNNELRKAVFNVINGRTGVARVVMDGGERYVAYAPIKSTGWGIGIVLPLDEVVAPAMVTRQLIENATLETGVSIQKQIDGTRDRFIVILAGIMAVIAVTAFFLARRITRPILALDRGARIVGSGNLDYQLKVKTGDEIEHLADTFNKMTADLKSHIEELKKTAAVRERIESELRVANEIQVSMLPRIYPPFPDRKEFDIYAAMKPAREVGGDFYDYFFITPNKLCFGIGDVCGKGVPAALFMAISKTLIRTEGMRDLPAEEILARVNNILYPDNDVSMFITCFCGILDTDTGMVQYSNGGHLPPLLYYGGKFDYVSVPKGFVVGAMPDIHFERGAMKLNPGDILFLYTDGVTEAANPKDQLFSESRLKEEACRFRDQGVRDFSASLGAAIDAFAEGAPQADDITMLILKYKGNPLPG